MENRPIDSAIIYIFLNGTETIYVNWADGTSGFIPDDLMNTDFVAYMDWAPNNPGSITTIYLDQ